MATSAGLRVQPEYRTAMALNVLRGLRHRGASPSADPDDSTVEMPAAVSEAPSRGPQVACPNCGRRLGLIQTKCQGCGLRLLGGVPVKHGALLIVSGTVIGLFVGGGLAVALALAGRTAPAATGQVPVASAAAVGSPGASIDPALISGPVSSTAATGLRLTVTIEDRLSASAVLLRRQVRSKSFTAAGAATTIRSIAADAAWGNDVVDRLGDWPAAAPIRAQLQGFYQSVLQACRDALAVSVNDNKKYLSASKGMIKQLESIVSTRKAMVALAAANTILIPLAPGATPVPAVSPAPATSSAP